MLDIFRYKNFDGTKTSFKITSYIITNNDNVNLIFVILFFRKIFSFKLIQNQFSLRIPILLNILKIIIIILSILLLIIILYNYLLDYSRLFNSHGYYLCQILNILNHKFMVNPSNTYLDRRLFLMNWSLGKLTIPRTWCLFFEKTIY